MPSSELSRRDIADATSAAARCRPRPSSIGNAAARCAAALVRLSCSVMALAIEAAIVSRKRLILNLCGERRRGEAVSRAKMRLSGRQTLTGAIVKYCRACGVRGVRLHWRMHHSRLPGAKRGARPVSKCVAAKSYNSPGPSWCYGDIATPRLVPDEPTKRGGPGPGRGRLFRDGDPPMSHRLIRHNHARVLPEWSRRWE